jgi:hypothetical protein
MRVRPPLALLLKVALKFGGGLAEKRGFLYVLIILFLKKLLFKEFINNF